ncbi:MAG TPA: hypothetical protein VJH37_04700 [Candidatus Nanoarchaeia archaeon]|nr:hypothetical protein [Candidatus Nanoarchaeia archaeon]
MSDELHSGVLWRLKLGRGTIEQLTTDEVNRRQLSLLDQPMILFYGSVHLSTSYGLPILSLRDNSIISRSAIACAVGNPIEIQSLGCLKSAQTSTMSFRFNFTKKEHDSL